MDRAIAIIELLSRHAGGLPLMTIADTLAIPRSATHRLLSDLKDEGYIRQEFDGGAYRLTAKIVALGFSHLAAAGVTAQIQPLLDQLADRTGELVTMTVVHDQKLIRLAKAQGARRGLLYNPDEGAEVYLAATSNGHAWLACLEEDEVLQLVARQGLKRDGYGPNAPRTMRHLLEFIETARERGYAKIFETYESGTSAIAIAVFDVHSRRAIGTISVAGPVIRMTSEAMDRTLPLLRETALSLARASEGLPIFPDVVH